MSMMQPGKLSIRADKLHSLIEAAPEPLRRYIYELETRFHRTLRGIDWCPSGRGRGCAPLCILLFAAGCLDVAVERVRYHVGYRPDGVTEEFVPQAVLRCERRLRKSD